MNPTPPFVRVRPVRPTRSIPAALLLAVGAAIGTGAIAGCSVTPPNGTPIIRAVPPAADPAAAGEEVAPMAVGRDGVIVLFKPGDRIDLDFDVRGSIAHVEGDDGGRVLVVDREFMVWSHGRRASISFDDGRTWRPADRAIAGSFDIDWRRTSPEAGGDVSEIIVSISASPR